MAIADEIQRIKTNIANAYTELENKGATIPSEKNSNNLASTITTITGGGSGGTTIEKGIIINKCNNSGYPTDMSIVGITSIPNYFFYHGDYNNKSWLSKVGANLHFSNTITTIGEYAFSYWKTLAITELPDTVHTIKNYAFENCQNLALIKLPSSLTTLNSAAFYNCKNITVSELPSGVVYPPGYMFYGCTSITEMTILGDAINIGSYAFNGCSKLAKLVLPNVKRVTELIHINILSGTPIASKTGYVYVPDDLVDSYKTATNWSTYASQIKGLSELEG